MTSRAIANQSSNSQGNTDLINSVKLNNNRNVFALINTGANINIRDDRDKTPLFYAVENNNKSMVELLVGAGADVNITDSDEQTALFYAVENNLQSMVGALVDAGIDVNIMDYEGKTALFYVVNEAMVCSLTAVGAEVNTTDYDDKSALIHAVEDKTQSLVTALLDAGADVDITDLDGKSALFHAVENNNQNIVQAMIDAGVDVNKIDDKGKTALFYAVEKIHEPLIDGQTEVDAGVNITDNESATSLCNSVENNHQSMVHAGIDVKESKNNGKTDHDAEIENNNAIAYTIVEDGKALVNARDLYGRTPLFYAITNSTSLARYLLGKGGNIHLKDNCNLSVLSFFIEHYIQNHDSHSLSPLAFPKSKTDLLMQQGMQRQSFAKAIFNVVFCKVPLTCNPVLDRMSNPNVISKKSLSKAVTVASQYTEDENGQKKRIFRNISTTMGREASSEGVTEILDSLIQLGANPATADADGNTALHYVTRLPFSGVSQEIVLAICHQLKRFGVPFDAKNHENETPLLMCLSKGNLKLAATGFTEVSVWSRKFKVLVKVFEFLLENGSSLDETLRSEETVFHLILKLFRQVLRFDFQSIRQDALQEAITVLHMLSQARVVKRSTVNKRDGHLNSPLHLWASLELKAAQNYSMNEYTFFEKFLKVVFEHLLDCGAKLNARNENDETPLHMCKTWSAVQLLIEAGANPNDLDSSRCSPLLAAGKNKTFVRDGKSFYSDVSQEPETFWRTAIEKGLDPWTVDQHGESVLSIVIKYDAFLLAEAIVDVACKDNHIQSKEIAVSLLNAICKDQSTRTNWKKLLVESILTSASARNSQIDIEEPLLFCCENIIEFGMSNEITDGNIKSSGENCAGSDDGQPPFKKRRTTKTECSKEPANYNSVHCEIAKQLRLHTVNHKIPKSCLERAEKYPALKDLLVRPITIDEVPILIPWTSVSKKYESRLSKVARRQECEMLESFMYHKEPIGRGSFGHIFSGISKKDGREVAIKRIENLRMQRPQDKREITNLTALADCEQVVRYLYFIQKEDFSYVVLELMEGNLDEYLSGPFHPEENILLCKDVLMGLKYLHEQNILHRDLKPTNILYKTHPKLCLKIADFGLSLCIDSTLTTVFGSNAGTQCWIAPEILNSTKSHSKSSDLFACGLLLHYILSVKKHPFSPDGCVNKGELKSTHQTESNIMEGKLEGWDSSLSPEATHLIKNMLINDDRMRTTATDVMVHPLFWSKKNKNHLLIAVGNQPEFQCPRAKRPHPLTAVESDLENGPTATKIKNSPWNSPGYLHMPTIYAEMKRRNYDTHSIVELVRFIRNVYAHVSEKSFKFDRKVLLEDFVFLDYFPHLFMDVYKALTTHGWSRTRDEISHC